MKTRVTILIVTVGLTLVATLSRWMFPIFGRYWDGLNDPRAYLSVQTTLLGVLFALLAFSLSLQFIKSEHDFDRFKSDLFIKLSAATTKLIRDDAFYPRFLHAAKQAASIVRICYFSPEPPTNGANEDRKQYYSDLTTVIKKRRSIIFKRLVRDSRGNRIWLAALVREFTGCPNMDLAIVRDSPENKKMGLALSVQIIDDAQTWFVAVEAHERQGSFRDLEVTESKDVAIAMQNYYERLWKAAVLLLDRGKVTAEGERLVAETTKEQA